MSYGFGFDLLFVKYSCKYLLNQIFQPSGFCIFSFLCFQLCKSIWNIFRPFYLVLDTILIESKMPVCTKMGIKNIINKTLQNNVPISCNKTQCQWFAAFSFLLPARLSDNFWLLRSTINRNLACLQSSKCLHNLLSS